MILMATVTRVISWGPVLREEKLDSFLFESSGIKDFERAMDILRQRPISNNYSVKQFILGLPPSSDGQIRFTIERVNNGQRQSDTSQVLPPGEVVMALEANRPVWLSVVDHITYAVKLENFKRWVWFYTEILGGKINTRCDDVDPEGKSSMMLWTIDFGNFSIALVAGIDREEKSHVTAFVERHGDRTVQHVAVRPRDEAFEEFLAHLNSFGLRLQGAPLTRQEGPNFVKQIFAWPAHRDFNPAEVGFDEIEARADKYSPITFSAKTGKELYRMAQALMMSDARIDMIDWSLMPEDWEPS